MGVFVKICGLARGEDVDYVASLKPDAMGFIFWSASKRAVTPQDVADWTASCASSILKVGVFVDAEPEEIQHTVETAGLDIVQLHGRESSAYSAALPFRSWKAVHLSRPLPDPLDQYPVEAFLVDSCQGDQPGGTGVVGDWGAARVFAESVDKPVLLAGGLQPGNVAAAIHAVRPWGVDVSSGVEVAPGIKDHRKVEEFISACRNSA